MHVPVVIVGAGPGGLAMSHHLTGAGIDHVVLERGRRGELVASRAVGLAASAHPELDDGPSGLPVRGRRPERLHDRDGRRGAPRRLSPALRSAGHDRGHGRVGASAPPTGFDVRADRGHWRCDAVVAATGGSSEPRIPALAAEMPGHIDQLTALAYRRPAQLAGDGPRARGRRVGLRRADRRRAPPGRSRGHHRRRRARPAAPVVPRPRHLLVDGPDRPARRALRRGGRHRAGASARLGAARRQRRTTRPRSQRPARRRGADRRVASWRSAAPRGSARVRSRTWPRTPTSSRRGCSAASTSSSTTTGLADEVGPSDGAGADPAREPRHRGGSARVLDGHLGHRVPTDLLVADRGRARPPGPGDPRRWRRRRPRALPPRPAVPPAPALEPHRRSRERTRRICSITCAPTSIGWPAIDVALSTP